MFIHPIDKRKGEPPSLAIAQLLQSLKPSFFDIGSRNDRDSEAYWKKGGLQRPEEAAFDQAKCTTFFGSLHGLAAGTRPIHKGDGFPDSRREDLNSKAADRMHIAQAPIASDDL
jgi:hypothetical protein